MEGKVGAKGRVYVRYDELGTGLVAPRRRDWRPFTIRIPFFASIVLLCLLCITGLEILLRYSMPFDKAAADRVLYCVPDECYLQKPTPVKRSLPQLAASHHVVPRATTSTSLAVVTTSSPLAAVTTSTAYIVTSSTPAATTSPIKETPTNSLGTTRDTRTYLTLSSGGLFDPTSKSVPPINKAPVSTPSVGITTDTVSVNPNPSSAGLLDSSSKPIPPVNKAPETTIDTRTIIIQSTSKGGGYFSPSSTSIPPVVTTPTTAETTTTSSEFFGTTATLIFETTSKSIPPVNNKATPTSTTTPLGTLEETKTIIPTSSGGYFNPSSTSIPPINKNPGPSTDSKTSPVTSMTLVESTSVLQFTPTSTSIPLVVNNKNPTTSTVASSTFLDLTLNFENSSKNIPPVNKAPPTTTTTTPDTTVDTRTVLPTSGGYLSNASTSIPTVIVNSSSYIKVTSFTTVVVKSSGSSTYTELTYVTRTDGLLNGASTSTPPVRQAATTSGRTVVPDVTLTSTYTSDGRVFTSVFVVKPTSQAAKDQPYTVTSVFTSDGHVFTSIAVIQPLSQAAKDQASTITSVYTSNGHLVTATFVIKSSTTQALKDQTSLTSFRTSVFTSDGHVMTTTIAVLPSPTQDPTLPTDGSLFREIVNLKDADLQLQGKFDWGWYFAALYLPNILAVLLRESWAMTASGLKLMEPFYQLSKPEGTTATQTLLFDHLGSPSSLGTFAGALRGSLLMITILVMNLIMDLLAPIASETMTIMPTFHYFDLQTDIEHRQNPAWVYSRFLIRLLEGVLAFVALVTAVVAFLNRRRRSGIAANPSKIATMASLLNHPNMVQDLHSINPCASHEEIRGFLAHNRYKITSYQNMHGDTISGLVKVGEATPQGLHRVPMDDISNTMRFAGASGSDYHQRERAFWYRLIDGVLIFLIVGLMVVIIAYWEDGTNSGFNNFFNSDQFGPRFILTLTASIITTLFQSFEREVRLTQPYRALAARNASARDSVLRSVNGTAASGLYQSVRHGDFFHMFMAMTALLGNVLIIAVAIIPFRGNLIQITLTGSVAISLSILGLMLIGAVSTFFWRRNNKKMKIPQEPNETPIQVWMSMSNANNQLRAALSDPGDMSATSLKERLRYDGGRFWAGWMRDDHGRNMWCIDKEFPIIQNEYRESTSRRGSAQQVYNPNQTAYRNNRHMQPEDLSQSLPFIPTSYRNNPIRAEAEQDVTEQGYPYVQSEYHEDSFAEREKAQPRPYTPSNYRDSPAPQNERFDTSAPHTRAQRRETFGDIEYQEGRRSPREATESAHLLRHS